MPFECKKYHKTCQANCCGIVPIPEKLWLKHRDKVQQQPYFIQQVKRPDGKKDLLPLTPSYHCPFLTKEKECAIYEDRPSICRRFGDESNPHLCCPMQDKDGNPREKPCVPVQIGFTQKEEQMLMFGLDKSPV